MFKSKFVKFACICIGIGAIGIAATVIRGATHG